MPPSSPVPGENAVPLHEVGEIERDDDLLRLTAAEAMGYFESEHAFAGGLVRDSMRPGSPCSVAAVGFAASTFVCACDLGLVSRGEARRKVLQIVRAVRALPMATTLTEATTAAGYPPVHS